MKIGIDCRTILHPHVGEQAGVGYYTYYLVKNLLKLDKQNQYVLFFDSRFKDTSGFEGQNVKIKFFPFYQYKKYLPITYSQMLVSAMLTYEKLDIFHAPANVAPLPYKKPFVVTVHDLAVYRLPDLYSKAFLSRQAFSTKVLVPNTMARASRIIAVSKNTKSDVIEEFDIDDSKIDVVYEGVVDHKDKEFHQEKFKQIKKKYGISSKYIIFLGTVEPRKNIIGLVNAFRNLRLGYNSPVSDTQLIIAGGPGWSDQPVYKAIAGANASILGKDLKEIEERRKKDNKKGPGEQKDKDKQKNVDLEPELPIKYIGYVDHDEKLLLLKNAECFVFPTLYEGFGLPVLEAMNVGTPVITSRLSSLPELVDASGAITINPYKESEIGDAIAKVATDEGLRESLSINGYKQSQRFRWDKCAKETLMVYKKALKESQAS
jgi:glycosyltransferase involved in cell wall biosynthesis